MAVMGCILRPGPIAEADIGFRQSQASLIWQELEEEEEGQRGAPSRGLFRTGLRGRKARTRVEEEEARRRRDRASDYSDDDRVRYFILGTLAAVFALLLNLIYPLLSRSHWA